MEQGRMDAGASASPVGDIERELSRGFAQLVHSKKRFAEEFGVPLRRVFAECPELADVSSPENTFLEWLSDPSIGPERLRAFIQLLTRDHAAMVMALDDASEAVAHGRLPHAAGGWSIVRRLKARCRALLCWSHRRGQARQMLEVAVPAYAWSYLRHRTVAPLAAAPPYAAQPESATQGHQQTDCSQQ